MHRILGIFIFFIVGYNVQAQLTQVVKGTVVDRDTKLPLIGATVEVPTDESVIGTTTDVDGGFILDKVMIGRHDIEVSYIGYEKVTIPNVLVTSGKEVVLEIEIQESLVKIDEVVVIGAVDKDRTRNEMATVSARTFSLEEVKRYSGGRGDASRLVANFAGVATSNDSRNDIVVRGNSPSGILWRMEGVSIPNPNHFSTLGSTGGPVSALNTNLLKNSDFLTSAFPAEYGNAISGVFDVALRNGNRDKFEFTAQLGAFSGLEAMVEGPIGKKSNGSSFLISYRYSFVQLADYLGLDFGSSVTPNYQDLTYNIDFKKSKFGKFSLFGLVASSDVTFLAEEVDEGDLFADPDADAWIQSKIAILGLKHSYILNDKSYIKTTLSISMNGNTYDENRYVDTSLTDSYVFTRVDDEVKKVAIHSFLNTKHSARTTSKIGVSYDNQNLISLVESREGNTDLDGDGLPDFTVFREVDGYVGVIQPYVSAKYRVSERFSVIGGLHGQIQTVNNKSIVEPRVGVNYAITNKTKLNFGYGLHSQIQPLPVFFLLSPDNTGKLVRSNEDLDFTKSHHFVLGLDQKMGKSWRAKIETYYQYLFDVPVDPFSSSFSLLNAGADYAFPTNSFLVNDGTGNNYGLELTIEKFFSKSYYGLLTGSIFQSKYKGSDGVERNTAFNNEYVLNVLAGKEWKIGKKIALTTDFKFTTAGGRYITPVDLKKSKMYQKEILQDDIAFSDKLDQYIRFDFKLGCRVNMERYSQLFFLDFQNLTNNKNVFTKRYNRQTNAVNTVYQIGFFPDLLWRIQF